MRLRLSLVVVAARVAALALQHQCRWCNKEFASRNAIFRHLREDEACRALATAEDARAKEAIFARAQDYSATLLVGYVDASGAVDGSFVEGFEATGWALARRAVHRGEVSADGGAWSAATRAARRISGSCRCIARAAFRTCPSPQLSGRASSIRCNLKAKPSYGQPLEPSFLGARRPRERDDRRGASLQRMSRWPPALSSL